MERYATLDGRTVRYFDQGDGHVAVLLHAFPFDAVFWRLQLASVPSGWRFIAPDLRGFGKSPRFAAGVSGNVVMPAQAIDDHARDLVSLLDLLDIERAVVGGLSMGGYVTFGLMRLAPARVRALILADTRAEADTSEGRQNREQMLEALARSGAAAVADAMLPKLLSPRAQRDNPGLSSYVRSLIEAGDPDALADGIRCLLTRPDSTSLLPSLSLPVHLVVGRDDEITPVELHERMQQSLPDASLTIIEGAGHLSNLEQPDVFNRSIARFLQGLS